MSSLCTCAWVECTHWSALLYFSCLWCRILKSDWSEEVPYSHMVLVTYIYVTCNCTWMLFGLATEPWVFFFRKCCFLVTKMVRYCLVGVYGIYKPSGTVVELSLCSGFYNSPFYGTNSHYTTVYVILYTCLYIGIDKICFFLPILLFFFAQYCHPFFLPILLAWDWPILLISMQLAKSTKFINCKN